MDQPGTDQNGTDQPRTDQPGITRRVGLTAGALAACTGAVGLTTAAHAMGDPAPRTERPEKQAAASAPGWRPGGPHRGDPHGGGRGGTAKKGGNTPPKRLSASPQQQDE